MMPLESSVSDATIWSVTHKSSIMILEASFTLIRDAYSTGITYEDHNQSLIDKYVNSAGHRYYDLVL